MKQKKVIPLQTFKRLPNYYNYLQGIKTEEVEYIAAPAIARAMGLNEVQVRKDLAAASRSPGVPRRGFVVNELLDSIAECLGYNNSEDAVIVGAGRLGQALLYHTGFENYGVRIVAAFDKEEHVAQLRQGPKKILTLEKLPDLCRRLHVHMGIITVPGPEAQGVCDLMVANGIRAIWNFAPVHLQVPAGVLVQTENLASQLAILSRYVSAENYHEHSTNPKPEEKP